MPRKIKPVEEAQEVQANTTTGDLPPPPPDSDQERDSVAPGATVMSPPISATVGEAESVNSQQTAAQDMVSAMNSAISEYKRLKDGRLLRTEQRKLPHRLTQEERLAKSQELAATFDEIALEAAHQAQVKEQLKAAMIMLATKQQDLVTAIKKGEELVMVDVDVVMLPGNEFVSVIRRDTGEPVETRLSTPYEQQGDLFQAPDIFNERQGADNGGSPDGEKTAETE